MILILAVRIASPLPCHGQKRVEAEFEDAGWNILVIDDTANGPLKTPADDPRNQRNIMKKIAECPISVSALIV